MTFLLFLDTLMDEDDNGWDNPNSRETIKMWETTFDFVSTKLECYVFEFLERKRG